MSENIDEIKVEEELSLPHPMTVNVGWKTFDIVHVDNLIQDKGMYAEVIFRENLVIIDPDQTEEDYKHTLFHELVHIALEHVGLGHEDTIPAKLSNEYLTSVMANALSTLISLNAELFAYAMNHEKH